MSRPAPVTTASRNAPGRPKDPAKRAAVLEAAKQLFAAHGFEGVSMDQIAQQAGVSKLTLYSHFGDKEGLLSAAVRAHCEQEMPVALLQPAPGTPLREHLIGIGRAFHALANSPTAIAGHRMLTAPSALSPQLAARFWDDGPARIQEGLAALLKQRVDAGELLIEDTTLAASHLCALLKGEAHARLMLGHPEPLDDAEAERQMESAIDLFLRAYARRVP